MKADSTEYLSGEVVSKGKGKKAVKTIMIDGTDHTEAVLDVISAVHVARTANDGKGRTYTDSKGKTKHAKSIFKSDVNNLLKAVHDIPTARWNKEADCFDRLTTVSNMDVLHFMEQEGYIHIDFRTICHPDDKATPRETLTSDSALDAIKQARQAVSL